MPVFWITTTAVKVGNDGSQYHRGFAFETDKVDSVERFADWLTHDTFVSGNHLELFTHAGGTTIEKRVPMAVGPGNVGMVSLYNRELTERGR